jgi:hypothetical protein
VDNHCSLPTDLIEPVDRGVAAHFARAADAVDASATAIGSYDIDGAISWVYTVTQRALRSAVSE